MAFELILDDHASPWTPLPSTSALPCDTKGCDAVATSQEVRLWQALGGTYQLITHRCARCQANLERGEGR